HACLGCAAVLDAGEEVLLGPDAGGSGVVIALLAGEPPLVGAEPEHVALERDMEADRNDRREPGGQQRGETIGIHVHVADCAGEHGTRPSAFPSTQAASMAMMRCQESSRAAWLKAGVPGQKNACA